MWTWNTFSPTELRERRQFLGGSEVGMVMQGGEVAFELWKLKTGKAEEPDFSRMLNVQIGRATEELNTAWFERETGFAVTKRQERVQHPIMPFVRCTLDGFIAERNAVFDCKHWGWEGSKLEAQVFAKYMPQLTCNARATCAERGFLSVFFGLTRWDYGEVEIDPFYAQELEDRCSEFWACVTEDREPADAPKIEAPVPKSEWRTVDMTGNNEFADNAYLWLRHKDGAKQFEEAAKRIKAQVEKDVGHASGHGIEVVRSLRGLSIKELKGQKTDE